MIYNLYSIKPRPSPLRVNRVITAFLLIVREWTRHNGGKPWQPAKWRVLNINTITSNDSNHICVTYKVVNYNSIDVQPHSSSHTLSIEYYNFIHIKL